MKKYFFTAFLLSLFIMFACSDSEKINAPQKTSKKEPVFRNVNWGMSLDEVIKAENWKKYDIGKDRKYLSSKDKILDTDVEIVYYFSDAKIESCIIWYDVMALTDMIDYDVALQMTNTFGDKLYKILVEKYGKPNATEKRGINLISRWEKPDVIIEWSRFDSGSGVKYISPEKWKVEKEKNTSKI